MPDLPPYRRKRAARMVDIAAAAGVSTATVNRVLNDLGGVSANTRAKVIAAAQELPTRRQLPRLDSEDLLVDVILARGQTPYHRRLVMAFESLAERVAPRWQLRLREIDNDDDSRLRQALEQDASMRAGLIVYLPDRETVRCALREQLQLGMPVVAVTSRLRDLPGLSYVGVDNEAAGRTAGHFLKRWLPPQGTVLLLTAHLQVRAHAERLNGCIQVLKDSRPGLTLTEPISCGDQAQASSLALAQALTQHPKLVGIYQTGAGSEGVMQVLKSAPSAVAKRMVWIAHELSDDHRRYVEQGWMDLVIDQDPDRQAAAALQHVAQAQGLPSGSDIFPSSVDFRLFCAENLRTSSYYDTLSTMAMLPVC